MIRLRNSHVQISERFSLLSDAWAHAYNLVNLCADNADKIMHLVVCHTLELMLMVNKLRVRCQWVDARTYLLTHIHLQGEWRKVPADGLEAIKIILNSCIPKLQSKQFQHIKYRCTYILNNIDEPWGDPTLSGILNSTDGNDGSIDVKIEPEQMQRGIFYRGIVSSPIYLYRFLMQ